MNKRYIFLLLLVSIFILSFVLRFYKLGEIPNGLYQDETAIGYNAYSILTTGKDEYGKSYPLYFKSFGDWKLPVYIYATVLSVKAFGLNEFAVRFPSAFFGFLTVIVFYFFAKDLLKDKRIAVIAVLLMAINPWSLHYNRATFEVSVGLFFFILGGYLLNKFFREKKKYTFFIGTACFIVALYSYNLTRLLSPLLFLLFIFYNRKFFKSFSQKEVIYTAVASVIAVIPIVFTLFSKGGFSSASGTLIFSSNAVYAPLLEFRSYVSNMPLNMDAILFNKFVMILWQYINNIANYLNVQFFFLTGSQHGNHGMGNFGMFYLFELPLILIGTVYLIKHKLEGRFVIATWILIVILTASLTREVPHATRSYFMSAPIIILSALGIFILYKKLLKINKFIYRLFLIIFFCAFVIYNIAYYFSSYYIKFPVYYARQWNFADKQLTEYIRSNQDKYQKVLIDESAGFKYSSLVFYSAYPPVDFIKTVKRTRDDSEGFVKVLSFGKYEFREVDWSIESQIPGQLIVFSADKKPENVSELLRINNPRRPVVISEKEKIYQFPVEEGAYVLIETK